MTTDHAAPTAPTAPTALLDVRGLTTVVAHRFDDPTILVDDIDLQIAAGERWAIVGESGSGKSLTTLSIMRLVDPPIFTSADRCVFEGVELSSLGARELRDVRGARMSLIQQDPLATLSPVQPVGRQIAAALRRHHDVTKRSARQSAIDMLDRVGIPDPSRRAGAHPHELSGGMRQRVAIALALVCQPALLFADEPTTALDVTVQAQVLDLLVSLSDRSAMAVVLITHDIGLLPDFAHRVAVMYAGRLVEVGTVGAVIGHAAHPYTRALLDAQPGRLADEPRRRLPAIGGSPPRPGPRSQGCAFAPRCPAADERCEAERPTLRSINGRDVACHHPASIPVVASAATLRSRDFDL